ncbi:hypothetical protein WJX72_007574 [[Myrmecia] bisecta]|uniref:Uncharacterized protein n=1 Tax=[Myrmecia] bisecta TaxID=41462 RepID=A0AAW1P758_9CHLO
MGLPNVMKTLAEKVTGRHHDPQYDANKAPDRPADYQGEEADVNPRVGPPPGADPVGKIPPPTAGGGSQTTPVLLVDHDPVIVAANPEDVLVVPVDPVDPIDAIIIPEPAAVGVVAPVAPAERAEGAERAAAGDKPSKRGPPSAFDSMGGSYLS